ncbi:N-acetyltransferase family protein [Piscinibacter sakaiensis]|uniref:GNAT family N-acetyltransferase n=1 Tax=Piscinibacter sakaiensis TaxID=1547922 RepID=UPI003AAC8762
MDIAAALPEHARGIAAVHVRSWQAAYAGILEPDFLDGLSIDKRAAAWSEILQKTESRTLVASLGDQVAGFVSHGPCRDADGENRGEVWALYVEPGSWRQGIGQALLAAALRELRTAGQQEVSLWVLSANRRGLDFYLQCGFTRVDGSEKRFELGGREVEEVRLQLRNAA